MPYFFPFFFFVWQAVDTVVAGILHDVVDDTGETLESIEKEFDADVVRLVAGVSRLSYINQVLLICESNSDSDH